jgi:hypothetical protein
MSMGDMGSLCQFPTFSGLACCHVARTTTPLGVPWCGRAHYKGTKKGSGGQNGLCSCGSSQKYKRCCARIEGSQRVIIGDPTEGLSRIVWSCGWNPRRWLFGYERDKRWKANSFYFGPVWVSRRRRRPV